MQKFLRIITIWLKISSMAIQTQLTTVWAGILFFTGKVLRFLFVFAFLYSVLSKTNTIAGYNQQQVILFFLVFNLIDVFTQALFRGVYRFRNLVVSGDYDLILLQPIPSFFRPIFGWSDIFDFTSLIPLWLYFFWFIFHFNLLSNSGSLIIFFFFYINSMVLAFTFHLFVCSMCILTTEIDHLVMIYRDLTNMARFPTDIYQRAIQYFLTFLMPVVILMTVPAKILMGMLSWQMGIVSILITIVFFIGTWQFWKYSISRYSSASS